MPGDQLIADVVYEVTAQGQPGVAAFAVRPVAGDGCRVTLDDGRIRTYRVVWVLVYAAPLDRAPLMPQFMVCLAPWEGHSS